MQCSVCRVQRKVESVQCTVCSVRWALDSVQCAVYSLQCTVYSVHYTKEMLCCHPLMECSISVVMAAQ